MNTKAQIGKTVTMIPVLFLICLLMAVFIFASYTASKTRGEAGYIRLQETQQEVSQNNFLFKSINTSLGTPVLLENSQAHAFNGKKFLEQSYFLAPVEQTSGFSGESEIYGISNEQPITLSVFEAFFLIVREKNDFSYYRYVLEEEIRNALNHDAYIPNSSATCFSFISEQTSNSETPYLRYLFFERAAGENEFRSLVSNKGKTAQISQIDISKYMHIADRFTLRDPTSSKEFYIYYGGCL